MSCVDFFNFFNDNKTGFFKNETYKNIFLQIKYSEFLANSMIIYIKREIIDGVDLDFILDKFDFLKNQNLRHNKFFIVFPFLFCFLISFLFSKLIFYGC